MSPAERLAQIGVKIKWAKEHVRNLSAWVDTFRADPDLFVADHKPDTGEVTFRLKDGVKLPDEFSCLIGDAVHNLRSSLDHLVRHLVLANTGAGLKPYKRQEFPFYMSKGEYETGRHVKVEGVPHEAIKLIDETKPYKGGNDEFWALYDLDRLDKHQLLIVTGLTDVGVELRISDGNPIRFHFSNPPRILKHGSEFSRVIRAYGNTPMENHVKPIFQIAFAEHKIVGGKPVVPFLEQSADSVNALVSEFLPYL
jgi:hypothetical protein